MRNKAYIIPNASSSKTMKERVDRANRRAEFAHRNDEDEDEIIPACTTDSNGCLERMASGDCSCSMVHR